MDPHALRLTRALFFPDRLRHNLAVLRAAAGEVPIWPVLKANAYGHGARIVASYLVRHGCRTLCVADVAEAVELAEVGIPATFVVLSATLPEHAEALVAHGCEPVVCTRPMVEALARQAARAGTRVAVHLKVDTGMGRTGVRPDEVPAFLEWCRSLPALRVRGLMSHFPRADEANPAYSLAQLERFRQLAVATQGYGIEVRHIANSAAIFALPGSHLDAVRPGIAVYGLQPSRETSDPRLLALRPVLEWKTRITFLKEVPTRTGLSYGHRFHTRSPSLIATIPIGYGDGLSRQLSDRLEVLVRGVRCAQVGRITMDMSLVDVTALRGLVALGDEVVVIGRQGDAEVTADELAAKLGTINYEIVTAISARVPRMVVESEAAGTARASPR